MKRISYKKLYLQEKQKRETYEILCPDVLAKYTDLSNKKKILLLDIDKALAFISGCSSKPTTMRGVANWMTTGFKKKESNGKTTKRN